jgi:predicted amidohydrolase
VGKDGNNINHSGDTMIVDPYGEIIYQAEAGKEHLISGTLSKQKLEDFRKKFTVGMDWDGFDVLT